MLTSLPWWSFRQLEYCSRLRTGVRRLLAP